MLFVYSVTVSLAENQKGAITTNEVLVVVAKRNWNYAITLLLEQFFNTTVLVWVSLQSACVGEQS